MLLVPFLLPPVRPFVSRVGLFFRLTMTMVESLRRLGSQLSIPFCSIYPLAWLRSFSPYLCVVVVVVFVVVVVVAVVVVVVAAAAVSAALDAAATGGGVGVFPATRKRSDRASEARLNGV